MTSVQPPSGFKPINGEQIHETREPTASVLSPNQKQDVKQSWDDRLNALEKPLKDLVKELKTAKGADLKLVEKKINEFEKQIQDLQQNIKNELVKELTPQAKKQLETKWTGQLKQMEQRFLKELPPDQRTKFDEKWNEAFKTIEKEISQPSKKEEGEPQPIAQVTEQKQTFLTTGQESAEITATASLEASEKAEAVKQIRELFKMVETLRVDQTGSAMLELKTNDIRIPEPFQGGQVMVTKVGDAISIELTPLPEKQMNAVSLMKQNEEQLQQLIQGLHERGINVQDLKVGDQTIYQAITAPTPFQAAEETARERGEGRREGGEGGQGGREGGEEGGREGQNRERRGR